MAKVPKNQPKPIITPTPKPENNQGDSKVGNNNPNSGKSAETGGTQSTQRGALLVQGFQADSDMRKQKVLSPVEQAFEPVDQEVIRKNQELSDPETLREHRFNSSENRYSMNMVINDSKISTGVANGKTYFAISSPEDSFGYSLDSKGKVAKLQEHELPHSQQRNGISESYFYAEPILVEGAQATSADSTRVATELAEALANDDKQVAFYTGAGFSKASGIDDLKGFHKRIFGEAELYNLEALVENLHTDPKARLEAVEGFFSSLDTSIPTPGHNALRDLAMEVGSPMPLFTENTDTLHQQTGIPTIALDKVDVETLKKSIDPEQIRNLDYLVTSGLSHDDRGFIAYLREINPGLKVISNDLPGSAPNFHDPTNPNDLYLAGSAHDVLPEILSEVKTLKSS